MLLNLNSHIYMKSLLNLLMSSQYSLQYVKSVSTNFRLCDNKFSAFLK